jgi:preprotein translocase subunit SecA
LLEYDDVMNAQRKAIYKKRKNALFGDRLDLDIDNMFYDLCESTVFAHTKDTFEDFELDLIRIIGIDSPVSEGDYKTLDQNELVNRVYQSMKDQYIRKNNKITQMAMPQIKHVHETMAGRFKNIALPLSDGKRMMQLTVNLEEAYASEGRTITKSLEKNVILGMIDNEWKEHLREMDDLRSAVHHAQYEQKDPLLVYKLESFELFKSMLARLNTEATELLMNMDIAMEEEIQSTNKDAAPQSNYQSAQVNAPQSSSTPPPRFQGSEGYNQAIDNSMRQVEKQQPVVADPKVGRNDPCPCGSGKKFKQCHGK